MEISYQGVDTYHAGFPNRRHTDLAAIFSALEERELNLSLTRRPAQPRNLKHNKFYLLKVWGKAISCTLRACYLRSRQFTLS